jgi:hypothetical protein
VSDLLCRLRRPGVFDSRLGGEGKRRDLQILKGRQGYGVGAWAEPGSDPLPCSNMPMSAHRLCQVADKRAGEIHAEADFLLREVFAMPPWWLRVLLSIGSLASNIKW